MTDAGRGEAVLRDPFLLLVDAEITAAEDLFRPSTPPPQQAGRSTGLLAAGVSGAALEVLTASRTSGNCATLAAGVAGDQLTRSSVLGDLAVVTGGRVLHRSAEGGSAEGGSASRLASDDPAYLRQRREGRRHPRPHAPSSGERGTGPRSPIESGRSGRRSSRPSPLYLASAALHPAGQARGRSRDGPGRRRDRRGDRPPGGASRARPAIARMAMDCPILPGGGAALADVQHALAKFPRSLPGGRSGDEATGARIVLESLTAPMRQLAENAGVPTAAIDKALKSRKEGSGIDPATGKPVPMRPRAVDPARWSGPPSSNATAPHPPRPDRLAVQAVLHDQGVGVVGGEVAAAEGGVEGVGGVVEGGDGDAGSPSGARRRRCSWRRWRRPCRRR